LWILNDIGDTQIPARASHLLSHKINVRLSSFFSLSLESSYERKRDIHLSEIGSFPLT
jgi:hypothetical protein